MNNRKNCQRLLRRARQLGYHVSMVESDGEIIGKPTTEGNAIADILAVDIAVIIFTNGHTSFSVLAVNENDFNEVWADYSVTPDSTEIMENLS